MADVPVWGVYGRISVPAVITVTADSEEEAISIARDDVESDWTIIDSALVQSNIDREHLQAEIVIDD